MACVASSVQVDDQEECCCIIDDLLRSSFRSRPFNQKLDIISKGRPTPALPDLQSKTKSCVRNFHCESYETSKWLCGCKKISRLFCWPCILFSTEVSIWTKQGVSDLNNFHNLRKRHEITQNHITSLVSLKTFGKTRIEFKLSEQHRLDVQKHNETVKNNRYIVSRFIDVTCFLAEQELPFRGHDESQHSTNRGNYVELLTLIRKFDDKLDTHLENSKVFTGVSSDIQNEIIQCVAGHLTTEIKSEISAAPFVAVIMDETTDVSNKSQVSTVLRYCTSKGTVEERFLGFSDFSDDRSANALATHLFNCLKEYDCEKKIVAQTYDGAAVMSGEHNGLQARVKAEYKQALFVHCYAHKLNLVLKQSVDNIKECKIFFMTLSGFAAFFSKSSKRTHALEQEVKKRFPSVAPTRWNYNSRLVETVFENKRNILQLLECIIDNGEKWDADTYSSARGFYATFQDLSFNFLIHFFSVIFPFSDSLFEVMQKKGYDIGYCSHRIEQFLKHLEKLREGFDDFWAKFEGDFGRMADLENSSQPKKRQRTDSVSSDPKTCYRRLYFEIIDTIKTKINQRFCDIDSLKFIGLLEFKNFSSFSQSFPEQMFQSLKCSYGQYFDIARLRSELSVVYSSEEFHKNSVADFHKYLYLNDLHETLPEAWKLVCLVLTIPATSSSAERSFSALKRIHTYLRNSQGQSRLSALSILSIEKNLLKELKKRNSFYDDVIEMFARKSRRIELSFK